MSGVFFVCAVLAALILAGNAFLVFLTRQCLVCVVVGWLLLSWDFRHPQSQSSGKDELRMHTFLVLGAIFAGLAVALGAFGAHALRERVSADKLAVFQTGVQYQMYHGLGLVAVGVLAAVKGLTPPLMWAGWLFSVGVVLFSGSLYVLTGSKTRAIGMVTPFGGLAFLAGWVAFIVAVLHI